MVRFLAGVALLTVVFASAGCRTPTPSRSPEKDYLILLSIDGFRWDYLDRYDTPHLRALAAGGVRARRMTASFPSKTFPNHYTLVTGLRPEKHGIVANAFYDPVTTERFTMSRLESHWWAGGEPIWITTEKQGVRSACFFWPGSETELQGRRPSLFRRYEETLTNPERVDGLLAWLDRPEAQRPRLGTLYFDSVDTAGHKFGPEAPETAAAVREADAAVGRLLAGLEQRGLRARTNLVIVSDHGMSETGPDRVIFFEDVMDVTQVEIEGGGPVGGVRPKPGTLSPAALVAAIRAKAPPQLHAYLREDVPARLHYRASPRISAVVLICDEPWNIERRDTWAARRLTYNRGSHGWDPATRDMGALFIAAGPAFRRARIIPDVDNLDVYNLLCAALGIRPAPNDGGNRLSRETLR